MARNFKRQAIARLRRASGQMQGLERMVADDRYCIDIMHQASAVREALSAFEDLILENHLGTCVVRELKSGRLKRVIREILAVHKLSRRN